MSTNHDTLWIVSPVYKDVESYLQLRSRIIELDFNKIGLPPMNLRFVLIDDSAGKDPQISKARQVADIDVVTPPYNLGHQRALVFGLRIISEKLRDSDLVVTMDADGEDKPEDLPRLLSPFVAQPKQQELICLAKRTKRTESLQFKFFYFFFRILFYSLTGKVIRTGNFAAYRGWTVRNILIHPHFDLCYSSSLVSLDLTVETIDCERGTRYAGESKMNFQRLAMHGIRMLMPFLDRISIRALMGFSLSALISTLFAILILYIRFFTNLGIPGWATYTLMLLLIISIVSISQFILLFTLVSQSQGIAMSHLEEQFRKKNKICPQRIE